MKWLLLIFVLAQLMSQSAVRVATASIQKSVDEARPGETILVVGPGIYTENVVIEKPLRLIGTNLPVLDGNLVGTVLLVKAPDVTISGLLIRNSGTNLAAFDSAIRIEGRRAIATDCELDNAGFGIFIRGTDQVKVTSNRITRTGASAVNGNGIHLWNTSGNRIENNTITDKRDGIYLSYAEKNLIIGNQVERSRFGIHYMYSHHNTLSSNQLSGNTVGATLMFARNCRVEGNRVSNNQRHGLLLKQFENGSVIGNHISGHNRGLFVQQAVQDRFENNIILRNDIGLYLSSGSEQNVFVGNSFIDNSNQVWQPADEVERGRRGANSFFEKGRGNFWSDYTGTDRNHDGIGDTPYYETDIYGYILDRHPEARLLALSPAATLLRKSEEILPLNLAGVTDMFPLAQPATALPSHRD